MKRWMRWMAASGLVVALGACDDGSGDEGGTGGAGGAHVHGGPEEEACEHMGEGPATPVTAAEAAAEAPAVADDHRRYDVTLIGAADGTSGTLSFAAATAGDYAFFLSAAVPFELRDATGAVVAIEATEQGSELCPGVVAVSHTIAVPAVGLHSIVLGPTTETTVSLVIEPAAHDHG